MPSGTPNGGSWYTTGKNRIGADSLYDQAGNGSPLPGYTNKYDVENRMVEVGRTSPPLNVTLAYDGEGRRVKRTVDGALTVYVYDAMGQLAQEYRDVVVGAGLAGRSYLFTDHLGSTRLQVAQDGAVQGWWDYAPFGEMVRGELGGRNAVNGFPYGGSATSVMFTGKERDSETGLDYFGFRYMSAAQGRFTSPDPINLTSKRLINPSNTLNKYIYAANNPLLYVDPTGRDITVFYRAPSGSGDFGHVLLAVTNQATGAVRFADYYAAAGKTAMPGSGEMNQGMTAKRLKQHASLTIQTNPEVAQELINAIDAMSPPNGVPTYWAPLSSCATITADLLSLAGIETGPDFLLTPTDVWATAYGRYSSEALSGGQLHMGLYRYSPGVDFGTSMSGFPAGTNPFFNLQLLGLIAEQQRRHQPEPIGTVCTDDHLGNRSCSGK